MRCFAGYLVPSEIVVQTPQSSFHFSLAIYSPGDVPFRSIVGQIAGSTVAKNGHFCKHLMEDKPAPVIINGGGLNEVSAFSKGEPKFGVACDCQQWDDGRSLAISPAGPHVCTGANRGGRSCDRNLKWAAGEPGRTGI